MKKNLFIIVLFAIVTQCIAQNNKKPLTFDDILKWNRITQKLISNDGKTIVYKYEPWKGDAVLKIINSKGVELESIIGGTDAVVSNNSDMVVFTIKPKEEEIRQLKLKKTKKNDMPLNMLGIYDVQKAKLDTILNLKSYKMPEKWDGWIAYQTKTEIIKDTSLSKEDTKVKTKKESDENGYLLTVKSMFKDESIEIPFVKDYVFAEGAEVVSFVSTGDDKDFNSGVYYLDLRTGKQIEILSGKGEYEKLALNDNGSMLAVIADTLNQKERNFSLFVWQPDNKVNEAVRNLNPNMPLGWEISRNGEIVFSKSTNRIYFGIAPIKPEKDTTILDEEIPQLDIWHWKEAILHTQQINTKENDLKKWYLAVYHLDGDKMLQLETKEYSGIRLIDNGDAEKVLAWSNLPYAVQTMWEGDPYHNDFYLIDVNTGAANIFKKDCRATPDVSVGGKFIFWYNASDTSWNTYNINNAKEYKITGAKLVQCADELNDIPNLPEAYGIAGWLKNDEALLVYDRFDIWKVDPENKLKPVNLTMDGKQRNISYRYIDFEREYNKEKIGIDHIKPMYLEGHNEITREDGYYKLANVKPFLPVKLIEGRFKLGKPLKAKNAEVFIYTKESFQQFPDIAISGNDFKSSKQISNINPKQKDFKWGTIELYSWTSLDGRKLEGLLVKPEDFDPNKKYPMIVNFYEKSSQELYNHRIPEAHRSTVDYHYYTSNGYIVFNPDIYYKEGYPGEDAFNCVMPGITQLISEGFVDEKHIAAQGHSWGGYQVAYLATRTNLFAAIESGAPVVNMYSAYGGIRLWTGLNRSFQYEHTQSRIGKSIWESPLRYLENSPLFTADKINTPMLIMHNENDGAVPFSQGIEFFIALRRLGKNAWLLNYNEADHWPTKVRDKYDFQVRLAQFFDHYLKGKPMPKWMEEGIPSVNKGFDSGY